MLPRGGPHRRGVQAQLSAPVRPPRPIDFLTGYNILAHKSNSCNMRAPKMPRERSAASTRLQRELMPALPVALRGSAGGIEHLQLVRFASLVTVRPSRCVERRLSRHIDRLVRLRGHLRLTCRDLDTMTTTREFVGALVDSVVDAALHATPARGRAMLRTFLWARWPTLDAARGRADLFVQVVICCELQTIGGTSQRPHRQNLGLEECRRRTSRLDDVRRHLFDLADTCQTEIRRPDRPIALRACIAGLQYLSELVRSFVVRLIFSAERVVRPVDLGFDLGS